MAYKQDIRVNIKKGFAVLAQPSFRPLILGSGSVAIGAQIITDATDLIAFGYLTSDAEYKMASAMFSQVPTVAEIMVHRKATATAYDDALTALKLIRNDFWGICIDSHVEGDLNDVGDWANANKKLFVGAIDDVTAGDGRNVFRESYCVYDKLSTTGYQEISSDPTPFLGATVPAITAGTYHINIASDGGSVNDLSIAVLITDDWDALAGKIQTALRTATTGTETVVVVDGKIKVSSDSTGDGSKIAITDGTGDDGGLLAIIDTLADYLTTIETASNGSDSYPDCAMVGRKLGREPYKTWKWKELNGISAVDYNSTQLTTIRNNNTWTVTEQAGAVFTNEGNTTSGDYCDIVYQIDEIESQITLEVLQLLLSNESVPLDDTGIPQIENVIRGVLDRQGNKGVIARLTPDSPDVDKAKSDDGVFMYKVKTPLRSEISSVDRASRKVPGITFNYVIAGAIHDVEVNGTLLV